MKYDSRIMNSYVILQLYIKGPSAHKKFCLINYIQHFYLPHLPTLYSFWPRLQGAGYRLHITLQPTAAAASRSPLRTP